MRNTPETCYVHTPALSHALTRTHLHISCIVHKRFHATVTVTTTCNSNHHTYPRDTCQAGPLFMAFICLPPAGVGIGIALSRGGTNTRTHIRTCAHTHTDALRLPPRNAFLARGRRFYQWAIHCLPHLHRRRSQCTYSRTHG